MEAHPTRHRRQLITSNGQSSTFSDDLDPFYASIVPQVYALAATTCLAYTLFLMLIVTPRSFLINDAVILGRRGFTNGPPGISIGGRPWLQKVAALTVTVSLTIATADTLKVTERQYDAGFNDAKKVQADVEGGMELKVIRIISGFFLWLAQTQTLIRLFPRQREKVIIKWTAFALITLDVLFNILNSFVYDGGLRPREFVDAIPALAYLFELALSLLYCAWVLYYAITKRAVAFFHKQMPNICAVALLSVISILVPVVFFVLDVSEPDLAVWGDYVRWVGAAAASVIVWEWVERIEALERNDRKDGVLGREVFDGDEMRDLFSRRRSRRGQGEGSTDDGGGSSEKTSFHDGSSWAWPSRTGLLHRHHLRPKGDTEATPGTDASHDKRALMIPAWLRRPNPATTPVSRAETASADSTVYAVRYHPISEPTPPLRSQTPAPHRLTATGQLEVSGAHGNERPERQAEEQARHDDKDEPAKSPWKRVGEFNPFRRGSHAPPPELSALQTSEPATTSHEAAYGWDVRARLGHFAATQAEKLRDRARTKDQSEAALPVTIIPAPTRRRELIASATDAPPNHDDVSRETPAIVLNAAPAPRALVQTRASPLSMPVGTPEIDNVAQLTDMAADHRRVDWSDANQDMDDMTAAPLERAHSDPG